MNRSGPKVKLARQLGIALTPKAARVMERRPKPARPAWCVSSAQSERI